MHYRSRLYHPGWILFGCSVTSVVRADDDIVDHNSDLSDYEYTGSACAAQEFPQVMAFRPYRGTGSNDGQVFFADGDTTGINSTSSFGCVEVVHDENPTFINQVEQHYDGNTTLDVTTIWHGSWASISLSRAEDVGWCHAPIEDWVSGGADVEVSDPSTACVWAGHLLYEVGTVVDTSVNISGTRIYVEDNLPMDDALGAFPRYVMFHGYKDLTTPSSGGNSCEGTENGWTTEHEWSAAAVRRMDAVGTDGTGDYIDLQSALPEGLLNWLGQSGNHKLWVAPIALTWNESALNQTFAVNLALQAPSYNDGTDDIPGWWYYAWWMEEQEWAVRLNASLNYHEPLSGEVRPDGVELDGGRWRPDTLNFNKDFIDADNDLCEDRGYLDGYPDYGFGTVLFSEALRDRFGETTIIQADSSLPSYGYRGYEFFNGIEMENFETSSAVVSHTNHNADKPGGSSAMLQHFLQWYNTDYDPLSYPLTKVVTAAYDCNASPGSDNKALRVGAVTALIGAMPHAYAAEAADGSKCFNLYEWDEYRGGVDPLGGGQPNWDFLGMPTGGWQRDIGDLGSNLISGTVTWKRKINPCEGSGGGGSVSWTTISSGVGGYLLDLDDSDICSDLGYFPDASDARIRAELGTHIMTLPGVYTLQFQIQAENTWPSGAPYDGLTDRIPRLVRVRVHYDGYARAQDVLVEASETHTTYYLSYLFDANREIDKIEFMSGEQPGWIKVQNLSIHEGGADRFFRLYDNGAAMLNLTDSAWDFTVTGGPYERLYGPQDDVNNGTSGDGYNDNEFQIPAWDGLIVASSP